MLIITPNCDLDKLYLLHIHALSFFQHHLLRSLHDTLFISSTFIWSYKHESVPTYATKLKPPQSVSSARLAVRFYPRHAINTCIVRQNKVSVGRLGRRRSGTRVGAAARPARTLAKYKKGLPLRTLIAYHPPPAILHRYEYPAISHVSLREL